MMMALLELWNTRYLNTETHLVLPYSQRLEHLADFLQQLTMESNGKRVTLMEGYKRGDSASAVGIRRDYWPTLLLPAVTPGKSTVQRGHCLTDQWRCG